MSETPKPISLIMMSPSNSQTSIHSENPSMWISTSKLNGSSFMEWSQSAKIS